MADRVMAVVSEPAKAMLTAIVVTSASVTAYSQLSFHLHFSFLSHELHKIE